MVVNIFNYVDENQDKKIDPMELLPAIVNAKKLKWLGRSIKFYHDKLMWLKQMKDKAVDMKDKAAAEIESKKWKLW